MRFLEGSYLRAMVCLLLVAFSSTVCSADLTKKQIEILENEFLPAWNRGNTFGVLESLSSAMRKMDAEQLVELDSLLAKQKIPASSKILLDSRLLLMRQGLGKELPRPNRRETILMLEYAYVESGSILSDCQSKIEELQKLNLDSTFGEFDEALWNAHVASRKLETTLTVVNDLVVVLSQNDRFETEDLDDEQKELLEQDFTVTADELLAGFTMLQEQEVAARVLRLSHATKVLAVSKDDHKERFLAAWSINQDPMLIQNSLEAAAQNGHEFSLATLQDDQLPGKVQEAAQLGRGLAGEPLLTKSRLLFEGMHWWFRGRYGMGTDGYGLLKSPAAAHDDQAMFALLMPEVPPVPTGPDVDKNEQIPEFDRRHHYVWAWEYRDLVGTNGKATAKSIEGGGVANVRTTTLSRFY